MSKSLPSRPNLEQLKKQAKELLQSFNTREPDAAQRVREFHPGFSKLGDSELSRVEFSLVDAQLTLAREYGFASWPKLKAHVETLAATHDPALALQAAIFGDDT